MMTRWQRIKRALLLILTGFLSALIVVGIVLWNLYSRKGSGSGDGAKEDLDSSVSLSVESVEAIREKVFGVRK